MCLKALANKDDFNDEHENKTICTVDNIDR